MPLRAEYRVSHADGSWRTIETVTTNMLSDPSIRGVVVSFRDITQRKLAEERLKKSESELRLLSQEIFKVAEKERARVARDLHDQIGSELAFLQTNVALMLNHMRRGQPVEAEASGLLALSEQIKGDCHRIVMTLGSTMIDDLGLMRSVEWYVEEFEKRTGIPCAADTAIDDVEMDKTVAMTAYRIVQEALTNVWKHSKASEARVEVSRTGNTLKVTVSDDGVGFDTQDHGRGRSLGLLSMAERAHLVGGKLRISSKIGKGTRVSARLPIDGRNSQREAST
jgi:signal transduction histidine kinase